MNIWDDANNNQCKWSEWSLNPKKPNRPLIDYLPAAAFATSAVIIMAVLIT